MASTKPGFYGRGFTLLEVMVAMAIFTLIGLAANSVLTSVLKSDALSEHRFQQLQQLQRAILIMERDLLQASYRTTRIDGEQNAIVLRGGVELYDSEADAVSFVRAGWQNPQNRLPRSNLQPVAYRLRQGRLEKLYSNYVDNVVGSEPRVKVLLEEVEDFQVEYYAQGKESFDGKITWDEVYTGTKLPQAIAITITTAAFGAVRRELLLVANSDGDSVQ